jgi:hypothetical protein
MSRSKVVLNFFSNAKRNLLVHVISLRCRVYNYKDKIHPVGINDLLLENIYTAFYALHDGPHEDPANPSKNIEIDNARSWLFAHWATASFTPKKIFAEQPLRQVRDYFGEKVAFYFSWLGFYTLWTLLPAIVGLLVFIVGLATSPTTISVEVFDNALTAPFAFFMSVWSTLFLEFWKRQSATLRTIWDVNELKTEEHRRPEWYGTILRRSPVTGKIEPHFPSLARLQRIGVSLCAIMFAVGIFFFTPCPSPPPPLYMAIITLVVSSTNPWMRLGFLFDMYRS